MAAWADWREALFSRQSLSSIKDDSMMWIPDYGWVYVTVILLAVWMMRP